MHNIIYHISHMNNDQIYIVLGYFIVLVIGALVLPIEAFSLAFVGIILGFLFRPAIPILGQLPFPVVITGGIALHGIGKLAQSYAQESLEYMIGGGIIGGVVGYFFRYFKPAVKK
ncbi:hypothetical protein HF285_04680 [Acidithiobacillus ferrooxidans F221]|uniref:hypothetical protein n=1 Tax=Acidithiobacillus ferrooxidans TaxID=920 RepID=UPI001C07B2F3|nr:hypothetical protein [Acidithiobacillus ferrooxidans]MBU2807577.1 hypothetical protein [Acidithiobacillus ferrooxidans F221]